MGFESQRFDDNGSPGGQIASLYIAATSWSSGRPNAAVVCGEGSPTDEKSARMGRRVRVFQTERQPFGFMVHPHSPHAHPSHEDFLGFVPGFVGNSLEPEAEELGRGPSFDLEQSLVAARCSISRQKGPSCSPKKLFFS